MAYATPTARIQFRRRGLGALAAVLLSGLTACTAYPELMDVPGVQKLTWFNYVNGDDLRQACVPGAPERYRFVYNGHYLEQVRTYEIAPDGRGGAAIQARVQVGSGIAASNITLSLGDPIASWRWREAEDRFSPRDWARFEQALTRSGFLGSPPAGLRLPSNGFYWVGMGCRGGRFYFDAWDYPSARFEANPVPALLLLYDGTEIAVNPPREPDLGERNLSRAPPRVANRASRSYFELEVGENGLVGYSGG